MKSLIVFFSVASLLSFSSCDNDPDPNPPSYIIIGPQDLSPSFSPDGEYIAYFHDAWYPPDPTYPSGLYIIDRNGANRKLVVLSDHINSPSWSPDGDWLVFSANGVINKCKVDGDELATFPGVNTIPDQAYYYTDWSPDGEYILFDYLYHPDAGLYSMTSGFDNAQRIFGNVIYGRNPELSPDGNSFVYLDWVDNSNPTEVFVHNLSTNSKQRLTNNTHDDRGPTWSPDGERIAWSRNTELCIVNSNGSNVREVGYGNAPSWSIKDEIVCSYANADFTKEVLFIMRSDGTERKQITL